MTGSEIQTTVSREIVLGGGRQVDILQDADSVADYLEELDEKIEMLKAERERVDQVVLKVMDAATMARIAIAGGEIEKDRAGANYGPEWNDQKLAELYDHAPDDPELKALYERRLADVLRPTLEYKVDARELWKLAKERPELEGIVADAESRRLKPRHVRVKRRRPQ